MDSICIVCYAIFNPVIRISYIHIFPHSYIYIHGYMAFLPNDILHYLGQPNKFKKQILYHAVLSILKK